MKPLNPASPHVIIMVGIPGAGKSAFAERFAETFQAPILNRIKLQRDLHLDDEQVDILAETVLGEYMKTKRTILLEGNLDDKKHRAELIKFFTKQGFRPLVVWVQTDTIEARRRATKPYPTGSGLSSDEFDDIVKHFQAPLISERAIVISGKHTYATQLKIVLKQIATNSQQKPGASPPAGPATQPRGRGVIIR